MSAASVTTFPRRTLPTILVLEDNVLTRSAISDELRVHGFKILEASSADGAIMVLDTMRVDLLFIRKPDLISRVDFFRFAPTGIPGPQRKAPTAKLLHYLTR